MKKDNKTCIVCSSKYTYCPSCAEHHKYPKWMTLFCSENCKKIFEITSSYVANEISKEEAKAAYDECDLTNKASFKSNYTSVIDSVYAETAAATKKRKTVEVQKAQDMPKADEDAKEFKENSEL